MNEVNAITEPQDQAQKLGVSNTPAAMVKHTHGLQIRSRDRVRDLAEVYTHDREVNAMLDLLPDMFPSEEDPGRTDCTFLEPACGHGNFLVEILRRKLRYVSPSRYRESERFEHRVLRCLTSIYGIDISEDNVIESCERMRRVLDAHIIGVQVTKGFTEAVGVILSTNIQRADSLIGAERVELVEYEPVGDGCFVREWSYLEEPELDLFSSYDARRDAEPVHYSALIKHPSPVMKHTSS